jgi:hypothetical protein
MPEEFGHFSGDPRTRWISSPSVPDRTMELLEEFHYVDPDGKTWAAPAGSVVDGASIPEALWRLVGSPYTGDYRNASIVHDVACEHADTKAKRRKADRMYYFACLCGGCTKRQAIVQYLGVRIGAWFPLVDRWQPLTRRATTKTAVFQQDAAAASMIGTFYEISADIEPEIDSLSIDDVEAIADRHLRAKAAVRR